MLTPETQTALTVLYADDAIVVVDKPANLLSVPGKGPQGQVCLWRRVQEHYPTARIVHRLDYATSGVMVLALSAESHRALSIQFQDRKTDKHYQAVVSGTPKTDSGSVDLPLRCDWERRPLQIVDHEQGKAALTHWQATGSTELGTRIELHPITGRSHQLRVHMMAMGHPIIGDQFYAPESVRDASPRLLLHAEMLSFDHPVSGERLIVEAPCPF